MSARPVFVYALLLSLVLHTAAIFGLPSLTLPFFDKKELPPPLEARLIAPPAPKPEQIKQASPPKKAKPAKAKSKAAPPKPVTPEPAPAPEPQIAQAPPAPPAPPPAPPEPLAKPALPPATYPYKKVSMRYSLYYGEGEALVGAVHHDWKVENGRYALQERIEAVGLAALFFGDDYVQRSEGSIGPEGLLPDRYSFNQSGKDPEAVDFDWSQTRLQMRRGSRAIEAPLRIGTQDLLSLQHQLYFMRPLRANNIIYVATARRLQTHTIEVIGEENLELPPGPVRTLHIKSTDSEGNVLELWLDRDRSLLPVRVLSINRKGRIFSYKLESMNAEPG